MTAPQPQRPARARKTSVLVAPIATDAPANNQPICTPRPSKLDLIRNLLMQPDGATMSQLAVATGWQPHSVRAGLTGLRKQGLVIDRTKGDGESRFTMRRHGAWAPRLSACEPPSPACGWCGRGTAKSMW